jgi:hypothetical protein
VRIALRDPGVREIATDRIPRANAEDVPAPFRYGHL